MTPRLFMGSGVEAASGTLFSLSRLIAAVVWHLNGFAANLATAPSLKVCLKAHRRTMVDLI
jgi:hypothetical protein